MVDMGGLLSLAVVAAKITEPSHRVDYVGGNAHVPAAASVGRLDVETPKSDTPAPATRWAVFKDRLAIVSVIVVLLILLFLMIDGSIENYRCRFTEFITFQC